MNETKALTRAQVNARAHKEAFLKAVRTMPNVSAAARTAGVNRRRPYHWAEEDPEFKKAWDEAEQEGIDRLEQAAWTRSVDGWDENHVNSKGEVYPVRKYSYQLCVLLLKAHRPEKYKDRQQTELTGAGGGPVEVHDARAEILRRLDRMSAIGAVGNS